MQQRSLYAVLTGDIIKSTSLSLDDLDSVRKTVTGAATHIGSWKKAGVVGRAEFFRGDSWQLSMTEPASALRAAVFVRASLLADGKADSRISIGIGQVSRVSKKQISLSTGEAFVLSGRGLDAMRSSSNMTIVIPESAGVLSEWLQLVGHFCDVLMENWTRRQAEVVLKAVAPQEPKHDDIAIRLNPKVSKQAVTKALRGAQWQVIRESIHLFERMPWRQLLSPSTADNP